MEQSLSRLKLDVIDLYQIHWPEPDNLVEAAWALMAKLQQEGKVRHIGVSNFNVDQMRRAQAIAPITSLQPPYSILSPEIEKDILPYAQANNIGVIIYSPMKSGLLTGAMTRERIAAMPADDFRQRTPNFKEPLLTRNLGLAELLADDRQASRENGGRGGYRVDAAASGGDGRDCGDAVRQAGGWRDRRGGVPAERGRDRGDRALYGGERGDGHGVERRPWFED